MALRQADCRGAHSVFSTHLLKHCFVHYCQHDLSHQRPSRGQYTFQLCRGSIPQVHSNPTQQTAKNSRWRNWFSLQLCQVAALLFSLPKVLNPYHRNGKRQENVDFECILEQIKPTKYDEVAIESYRTFCELRDEGIIPQGVRFHVSLPTPVGSTWASVNFDYREPLSM